MSIKSELSILKVNIQNAKNKLYTNLTEKGVTTITTASTLDAMANSVEEIESGGNPFEAIGYEAIPKYIQDSIDYAQTIKDNWDASITDRYNAFGVDKKLVFFPSVDTSNVTDMYKMFSNCSNLEYIPSLNTSAVTNMENMFSECSGLTSLDVSNWNTSKVTRMDAMFNGCYKLTDLDVSNWNTSAVTNMENMFYDCSGLTSLDVSNWNTSSVTNMNCMFADCYKLTDLDVGNWNTSAVTDMSYMFSGCSGLTSLDVSNWNTSKVTRMDGMFKTCKNLTSLNMSNWDTSKVVLPTSSNNGMFSKCGSLTSITFGEKCTFESSVGMTDMFYGCSGLISLDLSSFNTSNVTSFKNMFNGCFGLEKVDGYISFKSYSSSTMTTNYLSSSGASKLKKITFKDIGYHTNAKQFGNTNMSNWGVNDDTITDARQSLIDSLITYSFDRATAGYATCTVTLATNTKAVLTEDEIAAITAKGFTIA